MNYTVTVDILSIKYWYPLHAYCFVEYIYLAHFDFSYTHSKSKNMQNNLNCLFNYFIYAFFSAHLKEDKDNEALSIRQYPVDSC